MTIILNTECCKRLDINLLEYTILKIIYASQTKKNHCYISQQTLANYLGVSRQTINNKLKKLEKMQYIIKAFQYKRVSKKIEELFNREKYLYSKILTKHRENGKKKIKENPSPMLELFNEVYGRIKTGGGEKEC